MSAKVKRQATLTDVFQKLLVVSKHKFICSLFSLILLFYTIFTIIFQSMGI